MSLKYEPSSCSQIYCDARTVTPYAGFLGVTEFVTPRSTKDCRTALRKVILHLITCTLLWDSYGLRFMPWGLGLGSSVQIRPGSRHP